MILQKEIREKSIEWGIPPDIVDKDWVLSHVLKGIFNTPDFGEHLVFKGGTSLRKCYFDDYRFSEDLDFTSLKESFEINESTLLELSEIVFQNSGVRLVIQKIKPQIFKDKIVGYEVKIKYWGANHSKNQPPSPPEKWVTNIKIDANWYEEIIFPVEHKRIIHSFSDKSHFENFFIPVYSIEEIISEKMRAFLQRKYSAARDYFDIWKIIQRTNELDWNVIHPAFSRKCAFKNIEFNDYKDFFSTDIYRRLEIQWDKSLKHQLPFDQYISLDNVYKDLQDYFIHIS